MRGLCDPFGVEPLTEKAVYKHVNPSGSAHPHPIEAQIMPPLRGSDSNQHASSYNHAIPSGFARHPQCKENQ